MGGGEVCPVRTRWEAVLHMRTSALFGAKNFGFFEIYGVFARTRGEGVEPVRTFCEQGGRGSIFCDFLWVAPNRNYELCGNHAAPKRYLAKDWPPVGT